MVMPLLSHFHCPEPWKRRSVVYFQKINSIKCLHSINNFTVFLDTLRLLQHEVDKYALLFHSERGNSFEKQRVLKHLDNYFLKQQSSLPKKKRAEWMDFHYSWMPNQSLIMDRSDDASEKRARTCVVKDQWDQCRSVCLTQHAIL